MFPLPRKYISSNQLFTPFSDFYLHKKVVSGKSLPKVVIVNFHNFHTVEIIQLSYARWYQWHFKEWYICLAIRHLSQRAKIANEAVHKTSHDVRLTPNKFGNTNEMEKLPTFLPLRFWHWPCARDLQK